MRKTFALNVPNKKRDRQVDSIKFEVKKYIARENRKKLPQGADFWSFDCRIGPNVDQAKSIHVREINSSISQFAAEANESIYLEVLVRAATRQKRAQEPEEKS